MIVIVDDSELFRLNVKSALENKFDVEVVELDTVRSMRNFFATANLKDILLIILDLNLPDGNGLTAISKIVEKNRGKKIPFIIISKEVNSAIIPLAKQCGVGDIMAKPINTEELIRTIMKVYPEIFIPREKGNKPMESYVGAINHELLKAKKGDYAVSLFVVETTTAPQSHHKDGLSSLGKSGRKDTFNLTTRLTSNELNLVFPVADNTSLVIAPFVSHENMEPIMQYFEETLIKTGMIADSRGFKVARAVYPEDGQYAVDLINYLKIQMERNDPF